MLADAASEGALELLCLGDLVGYGADPIACVERVGERASAVCSLRGGGAPCVAS